MIINPHCASIEINMMMMEKVLEMVTDKVMLMAITKKITATKKNSSDILF